MEILTLGLLLIAAVLVSSVVDQLVPKVSLPLIQIGMGVIIALVAPSAIRIELNPDLFLVAFIAPLLYDEAKHADKELLWRDRKPILSLAIGLVIATTLAIGFAVNAVIPSIGLAAAFALGAALGPTDAVAVSSLAKEIDIPERQASILKGELLLNDASGIVSFQFALGAAITGAFSFIDAGTNFLFEFFGGLIVGAALGYLGKLIVSRVRAIGVENTTFHVLFEVLTPFLVYLISSSLHVSGIIAVVVAGLVNVIAPRTIGPSIARMNIVSSNVWHVLSFTLNGIVFVLLGTQLPKAMQYSWGDISIDNGMLIAYVLGITFVLLGVRFLWVLVMEFFFVKRKKKRAFKLADVKTSLVTTLCGAKGTITLSILFTIPVYLSTGVRFPQRDLVIFLACGVILCTLLLATFVVPLLAPKQKTEEDAEQPHQREIECNMEILRSVIEDLALHKTPENRGEIQKVIRAYNERLKRVKEMNDVEEEPNVELRLKAIDWEQDRAFEMLESNQVTGVVGYQYLSRLERVENLLRHSDGKISPRRIWARTRAMLRRGVHALVRELPDTSLTARTDEMRRLQIATECYAAEKLEELVHSDEFKTEDVTSLLLEYQANIAALKNSLPTLTTSFKVANRADDVKRYAYQIELEQIQSMYEEGRIGRACAKRMRENVHLMQLDLEDNV